MRTVALIQARMGSTRRPGKVIADIVGAPLLAMVIARTTAVAALDAVAVATTRHPRDDVVAELATRCGVEVVRGSELDVLDRYHDGATRLRADVVMRVTADCPLVDPELLARVLELRETRGSDLAGIATGGLPASSGLRRFPDGLDGEAFTTAALETAWRESIDPADREHVSPFLLRDARFSVAVLEAPTDVGGERWTVDHPEDLELVRAIVTRLGRDCRHRDILALLEREPELRAINAAIPRA